MKMNWGCILKKFSDDPWLGLPELPERSFFLQINIPRTAAGRPFIKGRVVHHLQNGDFFAVVFSPENGNFPAVICDGFYGRKGIFVPENQV